MITPSQSTRGIGLAEHELEAEAEGSEQSFEADCVSAQYGIVFMWRNGSKRCLLRLRSIVVVAPQKQPSFAQNGNAKYGQQDEKNESSWRAPPGRSFEGPSMPPP